MYKELKWHEHVQVIDKVEIFMSLYSCFELMKGKSDTYIYMTVKTIREKQSEEQEKKNEKQEAFP